jgi:hypothetical protein
MVYSMAVLFQFAIHKAFQGSFFLLLPFLSLTIFLFLTLLVVPKN